MGILDLLFPKQNKAYSSITTHLLPTEITYIKSKFKPISPAYKKYLEGIFVASPYSDPIILDLITRLKRRGEYTICESLSKLIYQKIFVDCDVFVPDPDIIIPIPPDPIRYIQRSFSSPGIMATHLSKHIKNSEYADILEKKIPTEQQSSLERNKRLTNLRGVFKVQSSILVSNKEIVWIIDDVVTTGTTLYQAAKVLKKEYPFLKIYGIVAAGN